MVEREGGELLLSVHGELLGISRSSLSYRPVPSLPEEVTVKYRIDEL